MALDRQYFVHPLALAPAQVAANTCAEQDFTVAAGLMAVGDAIVVTKPTAQAGLGIVGARVKASTTLSITYVNATGSPITPTTETNLVTVIRP